VPDRDRGRVVAGCGQSLGFAGESGSHRELGSGESGDVRVEPVRDPILAGRVGVPDHWQARAGVEDAPACLRVMERFKDRLIGDRLDMQTRQLAVEAVGDMLLTPCVPDR
jgi:hypothetical protein